MSNTNKKKSGNLGSLASVLDEFLLYPTIQVGRLPPFSLSITRVKLGCRPTYPVSGEEGISLERLLYGVQSLDKVYVGQVLGELLLCAVLVWCFHLAGGGFCDLRTVKPHLLAVARDCAFFMSC